MSATLLPSAAAVTVAWMTVNTDLAAIHGGRVGTRLGTTLPAIRVQRIGGSSEDPWEDEPLLQIDCWAGDEGTADLLARTVVAVLPTARGTYPTGRVWAYEIDTGPYWLPDDPAISTNARYILTVRFLTTP